MTVRWRLIHHERSERSERSSDQAGWAQSRVTVLTVHLSTADSGGCAAGSSVRSHQRVVISQHG